MGEKVKKACVNRGCGLHLIEVEVDESVEQCTVCNTAVLTRAERLIGRVMGPDYVKKVMDGHV